MTKQYEFEMRCTVTKNITVEADSEEEAIAKANHWDTIDERENGMDDWELISGPKEAI
jgi:hypothetical protein